MFILDTTVTTTDTPAAAPEAAPAVQPEAAPQAQPEQGYDWNAEKGIYLTQLEQKDAIINDLISRQVQAPAQSQIAAPTVNPDDPFAIIRGIVREESQNVLKDQFGALQHDHNTQQQVTNFKSFVAKELPNHNVDSITPLIIQNAQFIRDNERLPEPVAIKKAIDLFRGG